MFKYKLRNRVPKHANPDSGKGDDVELTECLAVTTAKLEPDTRGKF